MNPSRQSKVLLGDLESLWIDVDDRNARANSIQHRGQAATATTDHEDIGHLRLREKTKDRVYIGHDADAIRVALALIAATLAINEQTGVLGPQNLDVAEIGMIFRNADHDLVTNN